MINTAVLLCIIDHEDYWIDPGFVFKLKPGVEYYKDAFCQLRQKLISESLIQKIKDYLISYREMDKEYKFKKIENYGSTVYFVFGEGVDLDSEMDEVVAFQMDFVEIIS